MLAAVLTLKQGVKPTGIHGDRLPGGARSARCCAIAWSAPGPQAIIGIPAPIAGKVRYIHQLHRRAFTFVGEAFKKPHLRSFHGPERGPNRDRVVGFFNTYRQLYPVMPRDNGGSADDGATGADLTTSGST
jgi:hypothetical protein